jgi:hypothetical protein
MSNKLRQAYYFPCQDYGYRKYENRESIQKATELDPSIPLIGKALWTLNSYYKLFSEKAPFLFNKDDSSLSMTQGFLIKKI